VQPKWREPLLRAAAERGLPVLMAKPMANNVPQAELFAGIAADAGIPFMMENPRRLLAGHPSSRCESFACA
jgi:predicted dehydrogenase